MRILLDENVPVDIIPFLRGSGHIVESVNSLGWKGMKNGDILERAALSFDLFVTRDKDFDSAQLGQRAGGSFGIVLLALPQQPGAAYAAAFERSWPDQPHNLIGKVTRIGFNPGK